MQFDLLIKGGDVAFHDGVRKADIGVNNGRITAIAKEIHTEARQTIDASGQYVLPGMIDTHVHISEPGRAEWEGFVTGSRALAAGGTTSYVEMPLNALPATVDKKSLELKIAAAKGKNYIDYSFYGGLVPTNVEILNELADEGVIAFKCFMSTISSETEGDFAHVDDYSLYKGMQKLAKLNQILCIHAENPSFTDFLTNEKMMQGKLTPNDYLESRPIIAEVEAVRRALYFAKETGCKIHFVHISSSEAVQEITKARANGMDVTLESCPHYFALNANDFNRMGAIAKCAPPLREEKDQEKLWGELLRGNIDWLTSDHSPCTSNLKEGNIFEAWGGISGCQNNVDIMFDLAVKQRGLPVHTFADLIARNPAKRFNLQSKGEISLDKDADIILIDPNQSYVLNKNDLYYKNKFSPYVGRTIDCRVTKTIVRGDVVFDVKEGIIGEPIGRLLIAGQ